MENTSFDSLITAMHARAERVGNFVDLERRRYLNDWIYGPRTEKPSRVLYVGVGNGFEPLLALADGLCDEVVGIDPYIETDGNGDEDHKSLLILIEKMGMNDRFKVIRKTVQEYLEDVDNKFDLIIFNHVLHHIFWLDEKLSDSPEFDDAKKLFADLIDVTADNGEMVISELCRSGVRPFLSNHKLVKSFVNYRTKQDWQEWDKAANTGGWKRRSLTNYVPYRLRTVPWVCAGKLGRMTLVETYLLRYGISST